MIKITLKWMRALWFSRRLFSFKPRQRTAVEEVDTKPVRSGTVAGGTLSLDTRRRLLAAHIIQATAKADGSIFYGER